MKKVLLILFLIVVVIGIYYVMRDNTVIQTDDIKVGTLRGPAGISLLQMIDKNENLGENIITTYEVLNSNDNMVAKLQQGEYDIAILPTNIATNLYNQGSKYKLIGINTVGNMFVVANKDKAIEGINDLKGEEIYIMAKGATPDIVFQHILKSNDFNDNDVNFNYTLPQVELTTLLSVGGVDIALLPEPFVSQAMSKNDNLEIVINIQDEWKKAVGENSIIAQGGIIVKKELLENNPKIVQNFANKMKESISWVTENPTKAGKLAKEYNLGLSEEFANEVIPRIGITYIDINDIKSNVKEYLQILFKFNPKTIGEKLPDDEFFYKGS